MAIRGIIFDLDGVIVFTDKFHYRAWKALADSIDVYFDEDINRRLRGVSRMESLDIILEKEELAEKKNCIYCKLLEGMTPEDVSANVRNTLRELIQRGYPNVTE